jgi:hypothetical protein
MFGESPLDTFEVIAGREEVVVEEDQDVMAVDGMSDGGIALSSQACPAEHGLDRERCVKRRGRVALVCHRNDDQIGTAGLAAQMGQQAARNRLPAVGRYENSKLHDQSRST